MSADLSLYRANVGVVLFSASGQVWIGQRVNTPPPYNWQFPQGGVDEGEDLEAAARRELYEETGARSVSFLARTEGWLTYDYPADFVSNRTVKKKHRGQKQAWFAFRFEGQDSEFDLNAHGEQEFDDWRWGRLAEAPGLIVPFKRPVYEAVAAAFAHISD